MKTSTVRFLSGSDLCSADLYYPDSADHPPIIVMAHGFAGERNFRLPAFAEKFCDQGFAVLLFDYRTFGDSEGSPRQWVHPWRQLEDWRAAIDHARSLPKVNCDELVLWGTSFSGGHVVNLAAEDQSISAIIAQVPFVSGLNLMKNQSFKDLSRLTLAALIDIVRSWFGAQPYEYPVVAMPGGKGVMNTPGSYEGYLKLTPEKTSWRNAVPARVGLYIPWYSPLGNASAVTCPALILAASKDSLIPVKAVEKLASRISNAHYSELDTDHFQPYVSPSFEENIELQLHFLKRVVKA